jgi:hypothetical protein
VSGRLFPAGCPLAAVLPAIDRTFVLHAALWSGASLLAFGLVSAIIPNPVFGRQIPPEPFAVAVWLISAPLMGLLGATYSAPATRATTATLSTPLAATRATTATLSTPLAATRATRATLSMPLAIDRAAAANRRQGTTLGTAASVGAFLAIGCPVCNKVALVLLGAGGAMTVFAPLQPLIGAASLMLLAGTLAWRFRLRVRGGACPV